MKVITISRQYGSGGDEVASLVCEALGFQLFDKHLIAKAAAEAGLSDQEVVDYSEENYKVKSFIERLLNRSRPVAQIRVWKEDIHGIRIFEEMSLTEDHALLLVQKAIKAAHGRGRMVILGRGGQVLLQDYLDVIHIRIEAPMEDRIQLVKQSLKEEKQEYLATIDSRRMAQDLIDQRDGASMEYIRRYYGVDWSDPSLYHLVLNTGKMSVGSAAHLIIELVHSLETEPVPF
jgi:CMP/dCMP kinase